MLIPRPSAFSGGALTIEVLLLITFVRISGARRIFEFGTYMGGSTVLLAENSKDTTEIFTLDLPADASGVSQVGASSAYGTTSHRVEDGFLSAKATAHGPVIAEGFYRQSPSKKITFLRANALRMVNPKNDNAVIVWHDFDNKDHKDVGRFLRELAENRLIYAIGNTFLAFCFPNAGGKRFGLS
jgi:hypothetical protein